MNKRARFNLDIHKRKSVRLKGYNYSKAGLYFITICTHEKEHLFGEIENGVMDVNWMGEIAETEIVKTNEMRKNINIDEYVIMPNHIYFIIEVTGHMRSVNTNQFFTKRAPTGEKFGKPTSNTIPTIVRLIKSSVTKQVNQKLKCDDFLVWQRNYYENIMRSE